MTYLSSHLSISSPPPPTNLSAQIDQVCLQPTDNKGPRWLGDNLPSPPPSLQYAQDLPPRITPKYVFFFGFEGPEPECCLQQWFPTPFTEPSLSAPGVSNHFHTSEQYMMYHKALLMHDTATAARILAAPTPAAAKALGREVKNFRQEVWDQACDEVVGEGQYLKFSQNTGLGEVLLGTGKRELVEASPNDRVWGVGFNSEEAEGREGEWGENRLGRALMAARGRLRGERG